MKKYLLAASLLCVPFTAHAATVIRVQAANFTAQAGLITFSEKPVNTQDPTYNPADYGGNPLTAPVVRFGGWYLGQSLSVNPGVDCPGAAATACLVGTPTGPLTLDPNAVKTFITTDGAFPTSPTLTGGPRFNGPIAILFNIDVSGVGFDGGFFDAIGSTGIRAFDRAGNTLGTFSNVKTGIDFLGLVTDDDSELIAGVELTLTGAEPAGFNIDNLRFGRAGQIIAPQVPEPATWAMMLAGFGIVGGAMRRRQRTSVSFG
jgi:PEP-CTERM motif